jgi:hypothetical protein
MATITNRSRVPNESLSPEMNRFLDELWRNLEVLRIRLDPAAVAFAGLPAAPTEGALRIITDSSTATWGDTIAGGGANRVLGYFNGTNWTVAAI